MWNNGRLSSFAKKTVIEWNYRWKHTFKVTMKSHPTFFLVWKALGYIYVAMGKKLQIHADFNGAFHLSSEAGKVLVSSRNFWLERSLKSELQLGNSQNPIWRINLNETEVIYCLLLLLFVWFSINSVMHRIIQPLFVDIGHYLCKISLFVLVFKNGKQQRLAWATPSQISDLFTGMWPTQVWRHSFEVNGTQHKS